MRYLGPQLGLFGGQDDMYVISYYSTSEDITETELTRLRRMYPGRFRVQVEDTQGNMFSAGGEADSTAGAGEGEDSTYV